MNKLIRRRRPLPAERVPAVEKETGVSRYDLRPDIYGPAPAAPANAGDGQLQAAR